MPKRLLFTVTKKDFDIQTFRAGGKGGQNQNKVNSGVRIRHRDSGAVGEARDSRDQKTNKRAAFLRLLRTPEWTAWHKRETYRLLGAEEEANRRVDQMMKDIKVEVKNEGRWVDANEVEDSQ